MAKPQHPLEMAIHRFDDTVKIYFNQISNSFEGLKQFDPPKQKQKKQGVFESPFQGREIR